jgi:ferritin-like protein
MANLAKKHLVEREVEVDRRKLVETLKENKEKHVKLFKEAILGYREAARRKLSEDGEKAKKELEKNLAKVGEAIDDFDVNKPNNFNDYFVLVQQIVMTLPVPKSYEGAYDAAIAIAEWEVNDTMTLTFAEFNCFVRDEWDWKENFLNVSNSYLGN